MPQDIQHIDKIAREKQRDVLFIGFISPLKTESPLYGEFLGPGYSKPPIPHCRRKASAAFTMRASGWIDLFNTITMNADTQLSDM